MNKSAPIYTGQASAPGKQESVDTLKQITEEMYKQNAELTVRNKVLNILRQLYSESFRSLDVTEVSQSVVNVLHQELGLAFALISIHDKNKNVIRHTAISQTEKIHTSLDIFQNPLALHVVPFSEAKNTIVHVIRYQREQVSKSSFDLFQPFIKAEEARQFDTEVQVSQYVILPIVLNGFAFGALTLGLSIDIDDLSKAEREVLHHITPIIALAIDRARLFEQTVLDNKKLKELDRLKDEFLSIASHDLRTPMTAMKGYLYLILKNIDELPKDMREPLRRIYNSSERLIAFINDMLDVSRIESGRMTLNPEHFKMCSLITDVLKDLHGLADDSSIHLETYGDKSLHVFADRNKIQEVLVNLIGNAIKFTPKQGTVTISCEKHEDMVAVSVTDTGIGIAPEDQKKLFTKFGRVDTSDLSIGNTSGTGLGLYICKKIMELSHGQIFLVSEEGKGSTFRFILPTKL